MGRTFTSGRSATLPTGRAEGKAHPANGSSASVRPSAADGPAHDSASPTRIEPRPVAWRGRWCAALPGVDATLGELVAGELARQRTVGGGDGLWPFGRRPSSRTAGRHLSDRSRHGRRSAPGAQGPRRLGARARAADTRWCAGFAARAGQTLNRVALIGSAAPGRLLLCIGLVAVREGGADRDREYDDRDDQVQQRKPKYPTRVGQAQQRDGPDDQSEADRADDQQSRVAGSLRRSEGVEDGIASH